MLIDSDEIQKLRAAGFDDNQVKAVLQARAMANDRAREETISDMLRRSGFSASQAEVIASSACRHAQPAGMTVETMPDPAAPSSRTPRPRYSPFAMAAVFFGLVAIAIVIIATKVISSPSYSAIPMSRAVSSADSPRAVKPPVSIVVPAAPSAPEPPDELVFRGGKFIHVPRASAGSRSSTVPPSSKRPSSEEEWRREAAREFPALPIKGSPFNTLFHSEYNRLRASSPAFFESSDWPVILARTCHRYLSRYGLSSASPGDAASAGVSSYVPTSGAILFELYPGNFGPGVLDVSNPASHHAICKLIDQKTGAKIYTFVVLANSSFRLSGISSGTYRVILAYGDAIDSGTDQFTAPERFTEFKESLEFAATRTATGLTYSNHDLTLGQTGVGNSPTGRIGAEEFDQY